VNGYSELRINRVARPESARPMRHAMAAFLAASGRVDDDTSDDILTAVGEALANAMEHAYDDGAENDVELLARVVDATTLAVDVFDRGTFRKREPLPNRGFGLRIVEAIAQNVTIDMDRGTHVRMIFRLTK
jgi:anti-sigma regulatory factor (Ser/Thr protein kinase)